MAVTFHIPGFLRQQTGGQSQVEVRVSASATVAETLQALWQACPGLHDRVLTEQGELRQHVNIFVGLENVRDHGGRAASVHDGAAITIVPAVSGGQRDLGAAPPDNRVEDVGNRRTLTVDLLFEKGIGNGS